MYLFGIVVLYFIFTKFEQLSTLRKEPMFNLNNPNIIETLYKLDPCAISKASPRHVQSVLEDLITLCLQSQTLADRVLRLNPAVGEIGEGMLRNLQEIASSIVPGRN